MTPEYLRQLAQKMLETGEFQETVAGCANTLRTAAAQIERLENRFEGPYRLIAVGRPLGGNPSTTGITCAIRALIGNWVVGEYLRTISLETVGFSNITRPAAEIYALLIGLDRAAHFPGGWQGEVFFESPATAAFFANPVPTRGLPKLLTSMGHSLRGSYGHWRDITWQPYPKEFQLVVSEHYAWCLASCEPSGCETS